MAKFTNLISFWYFLLLIKFSICQNDRESDITDKIFGVGPLNSFVAAYGDFNSDEITDVFMLHKNFHIIDIYLGEDTEKQLQISPELRCNHSDLHITNLVPGDFDGDAFMDVMFTAKLDDNDDTVGVYINWGGSNYINCTTSTRQNPLIKMKGEPIALDYKDDMIIDLFGTDTQGNRIVWVFKKGRDLPDIVQLVDGNSKSFDPITIPHSNAILDLNNDHLADLFITTQNNFEIWHGSINADNERNYTLGPKLQFFVGSHNIVVGQVLFIDMELVGELNLLVPVYFNNKWSNSSIYINTYNGFVDLGVNFVDNTGKQWGFVPPSKSEFYRQTITLRGGDYNMDGYPDLIATLTNDGGKTMRTFLLKNIEAPNPHPGKFRRTFEVQWNALLPHRNNTVMGSFYDFGQDGILDVILLQRNGNDYTPLAFRNTLDYDANFVKVIVLTGLTNETKPAKRTPLGRKKRTYGTNLPGPSIDFYTTTQEGNKMHGASTQLPQSAYFSLHLPYTIFGLGRTPNFVDQVVVGLANRSRTWPQLIPNSQIIVIPWPTEDPQNWKAQLFVTPSKIILKSIFALSGVCLVILFIILFLHIKERREDKIEKLQEQHRFHFDAM